MTKQMKKMLIITAIVLGIIFGWYGVKKILFWYFVSHYEMPPVTISATTATAKTWRSYLTSVGTLVAVNGVNISSEASGIVRQIQFHSGQFVRQGDVLVLLDTSIETAQLKNDQAQLQLAQINFNRDKSLLAKHVIAQSAFDTTQAQLEGAAANLQVTQAKINQKTITAPFAGKIGINLVNLGEYLAAGTTMVTLQSLDPLYVHFNLPEQYLSQLSLDQSVDVTLSVNGSQKKVVHGKITAINAKVDQSTRNILVEATIPNADLQLYPGMFASVMVWLKEEKNVIVLPQTSISYSLHGDSVFIIKEKGKDKHKKPILHAFRAYVETGDRRDAEVSITKGVTAGDQIATSGQLKLQNDTHVVIDNSAGL